MYGGHTCGLHDCVEAFEESNVLVAVGEVVIPPHCIHLAPLEPQSLAETLQSPDRVACPQFLWRLEVHEFPKSFDVCVAATTKGVDGSGG